MIRLRAEDCIATMTGGNSLLSPEVFILWHSLIQGRTNIRLMDNQRDFLARRLQQRMTTLGIEDFRDYYNAVCSEKSGQEWQQLLELLVNNESEFFRHLPSFNALQNEVLPAVAASKINQGIPPLISMWSAGSSRGQEAYSLAMCFYEFTKTSPLFHDGMLSGALDINVLGTDISRKALSRAEAGEYSAQEIRTLPGTLRDEYFSRIETDISEGFLREGNRFPAPTKERFRIHDNIRRKVHFQHLNLKEPQGPPGPLQDIIFCHNVFLYFSKVDRAKTTALLLNQLSPGGYLFLGPAENLGIEISGASVARFKDTVGFKRNEEPVHVHVAR